MNHKTPYPELKEAALKLPDEVKARIMRETDFCHSTGEHNYAVSQFNAYVGLRSGPARYLNRTWDFFSAIIDAVNEQEEAENRKRWDSAWERALDVVCAIKDKDND